MDDTKDDDRFEDVIGVSQNAKGGDGSFVKITSSNVVAYRGYTSAHISSPFISSSLIN